MERDKMPSSIPKHMKNGSWEVTDKITIGIIPKVVKHESRCSKEAEGGTVGPRLQRMLHFTT